MISITSTSNYVTALNTGYSPYINVNHNNPGQGQLRYVNNRLEVFDGSTWSQIQNSVTMGLNARAEQAIAWAIERQEQEQKWAELARKHPAVADALAGRQQAENTLAVVAILCGELET